MSRYRIRWATDATERAIQVCIARWHIAGCLKLLAGD